MRKEDHDGFFAVRLNPLRTALISFAAGLAAAYVVGLIPLDFSAELREAGRLGIVSLTTLSGYPKSLDLVNFVSVTLLPVLFFLAALLFSRAHFRNVLQPDVGQPPDYAAQSKIGLLAAVSAVYLYASLDLNFFYGAGTEWEFLGEEGYFLDCVQHILHGEVYGRDFRSPYGFLLVYPLVWFMKLFGATVVVQRVFSWLLNLGGYAVILYFLYRHIRSRLFFAVSALCFLLIFSPYPYAPHIAYLRFFFGILPVALLASYQEKGGRILLVAAGAAAGVYPLISLEFGLCSWIAALAFFAMRYFSRFRPGETFRETLIFGSGFAIPAAGAVVWNSFNGGLFSLLNWNFQEARLYGLGVASLPFPSLRKFLSAPLSEGVMLPYLIMFGYSAAIMYVAYALFIGRFDRRTALAGTLAAYGMSSFRYALGRSDAYHVFQVSFVLFLLLFLLLDGLFENRAKGLRNPAKTGAAAMVIIAALLSLLAWNDEMIRFNLGISSDSFLHPWRKFAVRSGGRKLNDLPRAGVYIDDKTAGSIEKIGRFLDGHTAKGEYVYFFPFEPAYYFIFDRRNPTGYMYGYAGSSAQRLEIIDALQRNKPRYFVYSVSTVRPDDIPLEQKVPELLQYLANNYTPVENYGDVMIAERKTPGRTGCGSGGCSGGCGTGKAADPTAKR